jgi:hypothetical protein
MFRVKCTLIFVREGSIIKNSNVINGIRQMFFIIKEIFKIRNKATYNPPFTIPKLISLCISSFFLHVHIYEVSKYKCRISFAVVVFLPC